MKLDEAEKVGEVVLRGVKLSDKEGNKILGRFVEVKTLPRPNDPMGDSRVVVLTLEDTNMELGEDQVDGKNRCMVYMSGQLDSVIAKICGQIKPDDEPMLLITYEGISKNVETKEYGTKDVHRYTVKIVPDKKK